MLGVLCNLLFPFIFKDRLVVLSVHFWFSSVLVELCFGHIRLFRAFLVVVVGAFLPI